MSSERVPRVALVGYGYWGPNLLRNLVAIDRRVVARVCDRSPERLAEVQREYPGLPTSTEVDELLADPSIEGLMLALPAGEQQAVALRAIEAGKHLFVEKPLAPSLVEAQRLVSAASEHELLLMEGLIYRYHAMVDRMAGLIRDGALGRILSVYSQRANLQLRPKHANVIWTLAPHDVSILRYWLGASPERIVAHAQRVADPEREDVAFIEMSFPEGVLAHVHLSWLDPVRARRIVVVGAEKIAIFDEVASPLSVSIYDNPDARREWPHDFSGMDRRVRHLGQPIEVVGSGPEPEEPLHRECRHFLECVAGRVTPRVDGQESLEVIRVIEAIHHALERGAAPGVTDSGRVTS